MREVKREIVLIGTSNMFYTTAFKEACLVNIKLGFKDWFFSYKNSSKTLLFSRKHWQKPDILSEKFETLTSSNYHRVEYFFAEILHTSAIYQFYLDLELFAKIKNYPVYRHPQKPSFLHFH